MVDQKKPCLGHCLGQFFESVLLHCRFPAGAPSAFSDRELYNLQRRVIGPCKYAQAHLPAGYSPQFYHQHACWGLGISSSLVHHVPKPVDCLEVSELSSGKAERVYPAAPCAQHRPHCTRRCALRCPVYLCDVCVQRQLAPAHAQPISPTCDKSAL